MSSHHTPLAEPRDQQGIFLILLVLTDLGFVAVHLAHTFRPFSDGALYYLTTDRGYAEAFQYVKNYWIVIMLMTLWWRISQRVFFAWMLLYLYLLCDDALQLHETMGGLVSSHWGFEGALGLRGKDLGELAVSVAVGVGFLVLILVAHLRSPRDAKYASRDMAVMFGLLAFFGVFVDMVHAIFKGGHAETVLSLVEDGGEMVAMSLTCWYVFVLLKRRGHVATALFRARLT